jgi:hypothetical protein
VEVATDNVSMNTRNVYISTTELNGEKMSPKEIKKWLKRAIKVSGTHHELIEQANISLGTGDPRRRRVLLCLQGEGFCEGDENPQEKD